MVSDDWNAIPPGIGQKQNVVVGDCPPLDRIAEYAEGALDRAGRRAMKRHLKQCSSCASVAADLMPVFAPTRRLHQELLGIGGALRAMQGRLSPDEQERWQIHIESCKHCRSTEQKMRGLRPRKRDLVIFALSSVCFLIVAGFGLRARVVHIGANSTESMRTIDQGNPHSDPGMQTPDVDLPGTNHTKDIPLSALGKGTRIGDPSRNPRTKNERWHVPGVPAPGEDQRGATHTTDIHIGNAGPGSLQNSLDVLIEDNNPPNDRLADAIENWEAYSEKYPTDRVAWVKLQQLYLRAQKLPRVAAQIVHPPLADRLKQARQREQALAHRPL